jgi:3-dehydroquinate synthase
MQPVFIQLSNHSYAIHIAAGALARVGEWINPLAPSRVFIVTDENCAQHYVMPLIASLRAAQLDMATPIMVPAGEATKSFAQLESVCRQLVAGGIDRGGIIIALGGGVVGDLAGFAAATILRGVRYVQIPTSLLAQVDSSVGGKTGVNLPEGKNLAGAFHQPSLVVIDPDVLKTLPPRELLAGYAEIIKYGLINDAEFFGWCEMHGANMLLGDADHLVYAIRKSIEHKAAIVTQDPDERTGVRALLNLGHTFAHAYEKLASYNGALLHGEAVALGLVKAAQLSAHLGLCRTDLAERIAAHLGTIGLPVDPKFYGDFPADDLLRAMRGDKKNAGGQLNMILLRGAGQAFVAKDVLADAVRAVL